MNRKFTSLCLPRSDTGSSLRRNLDPDLNSEKQYADPKITVIFVNLQLIMKSESEYLRLFRTYLGNSD